MVTICWLYKIFPRRQFGTGLTVHPYDHGSTESVYEPRARTGTLQMGRPQWDTIPPNSRDESTSPLECPVCQRYVQEESIVRVRNGRVVHLECCRDSPPPSYALSDTASSHGCPYSTWSCLHHPERSISTLNTLETDMSSHSCVTSPSTSSLLLECHDTHPETGDHHCITHLPTYPNRASLPPEVWDMIIDYLLDEPRTLISCAFVCKTWFPRCRKHLSQSVVRVASHHDVLRLSAYVRAHHTFAKREFVTIRGGADRSLSHLPTFSALLAGRMPRLESLVVECGVWRYGMTDAGFFTRVASFASISRLTLNDVSFPSTSIFARFVFSFERLVELYLINVSTVKKYTGRQLLLPLTNHSRLLYLNLVGSQVHDLVELFTVSGICGKLRSLALHVGSASFLAIDASSYRNLLSACRSLRALHLTFRDTAATKEISPENTLGSFVT